MLQEYIDAVKVASARADTYNSQMMEHNAPSGNCCHHQGLG
uniref:Uncharacterized protein n=1 Tax=Candidatus Kentrum sp. TUN TaxID=2126343 RepID=A0A451B2U0_9GAMM|nr:MAG: hypothetical protein BECKTUN1418F_GA0071002_14452 [Candidatus Kentron sp. TUN]VFK72583.1 MAG: hypothetical protein BECKTUN1418E_GA0071001_14482 [Candidatus Kentron sp. TUN]